MKDIKTHNAFVTYYDDIARTLEPDLISFHIPDNAEFTNESVSQNTQNFANQHQHISDTLDALRMQRSKRITQGDELNPMSHVLPELGKQLKICSLVVTYFKAVKDSRKVDAKVLRQLGYHISLRQELLRRACLKYFDQTTMLYAMKQLKSKGWAELIECIKYLSDEAEKMDFNALRNTLNEFTLCAMVNGLQKGKAFKQYIDSKQSEEFYNRYSRSILNERSLLAASAQYLSVLISQRSKKAKRT